MKNRTFAAFVSDNMNGYYPPIAAIKSGRYGKYCDLNGINYSFAKIAEMGYHEVKITRQDEAAIMAEWRNNLKQDNQLRYEADLLTRISDVEHTIKCAPIEISQKKSEICPTANLAGTDMIQSYHGCGKGTAWCKDGKVYAFHYGYNLPMPKQAELSKMGLHRVEVSLSCTQICFF